MDRLRVQDGLDRFEELERKVRTADEQLASTSAVLKEIRVRMRRRRQGFYEEEPRLAWKRRDLAATFRWSRLLGGRRWGAKKRDYRAMTAALPSRRAWQDEWTKPGAEGGMSAAVLDNWSEWRARTRDLEKQSLLNAGAVVEARRDMKDLERSCLTVKERLLCRVRSSGTVPLAWHHSSRAPLHKSNKPGHKGRGVVHVLPSMEKQFFKARMRRKPNGGGWSQPEPADWLHGYVSGRRRESAVLIRQVTTWRLERIGLKSRPFTIRPKHLDRSSGRRWTGLWRPCWGRMLLSGSRDTGWRLQRFQEETATSHSRSVRAGSWGMRSWWLCSGWLFHCRRSVGSSRWLKVRNLNSCWHGPLSVAVC